jgi:hypothetical protein
LLVLYILTETNVDSALLFALLLFAGIALCIVIPVVLRLYCASRVEEITPEWLESFSVELYEPMEGLLSSRDFDFLKRQPGFDSAALRRFRRERLHIFRQYLNRMIRDFNRLQLAARILVAHSSEDRSAQVLKRLVWLRVRFFAAVVRVEFSYAACRFGCSKVPARALLDRLAEMSTELATLSATRAFSVSLS